VGWGDGREVGEGSVDVMDDEEMTRRERSGSVDERREVY